jgi:hypothetical protein
LLYIKNRHDEAKQFRSKCTFSPVLLNDTYSCADLYHNQSNGSITFSHGQNETDAYNIGSVHIIISYRRTSQYGFQVQIYINTIVIRSASNNNSFTNWLLVGKP